MEHDFPRPSVRIASVSVGRSRVGGAPVLTSGGARAAPPCRGNAAQFVWIVGSMPMPHSGVRAHVRDAAV